MELPAPQRLPPRGPRAHRRARGKPVAGARVQQLLLEGAPDGPEGEKLKAFLNWAYGGEPIVDKEGKFLVSLGQYSQFVRNAYFHVTAPGFAPQRVGPIAIDSAKPTADLKIELKPGFSGRLRLVLTDGKPLDKGEVEVTVQDDLWAWSMPMAEPPWAASRSPSQIAPQVRCCSKFAAGDLRNRKIRDVELVADKVVEVKVDPKPKEAFYFRGKEALERIESVKPAWSDSQNGIEFGIARIGDKKEFYSGERVPLELFIRNTGDKAVKIEIAPTSSGMFRKLRTSVAKPWKWNSSSRWEAWPGIVRRRNQAKPSAFAIWD